MGLDERLAFSRVSCERCGAHRVLEMPCADCGYHPRHGEVNGPVVQRRQAAREVEKALALLPESSRAVDDAKRLREDLLWIIDEFFASFSELLRATPSADGPNRLARVVRFARDLELSLRLASSVRPTAQARAFLATVSELNRLWPIYLSAMTTADMLAAQTAAKEGQRILDHSTESLHWFTLIQAAAESISDNQSEPSLAKRVVDALIQMNPSSDLAALGANGQKAAQELLEDSVGVGSGLDYLTLQLVGNAYLDPTVLSAKLKELNRLSQNADRLNEVASMEEAVTELSVVRRDLFETLTQFELVTRQEKNPAAILRRFIKVVGELYESALPLLAWSRLLGSTSSGSDRFLRLLRDDATSLVDKLKNSLPLTFGDMPGYLRNSAHHGRAIDVDDGTATVTVRLRSHQETLAVEDYIDRSYALLESLLALNWTLSNALEKSGITIPIPPTDAEHMGLTLPDLASVWFSQKGIDISQNVVLDNVWILEGDWDGKDALTIALSLAAMVDGQIREIRVSEPGNTNSELEMPYAAYSQYADAVSEESSHDLLLGLLELRHRTTLDGHCVLTAQDVKFAIAALGIFLLEGDLTQIRRLRTLRSLARQHGFDELEELAEKSISGIRLTDASQLKSELSRHLENSRAPQIPVTRSAYVILGADTPSRPRPCDVY